ncbi:MAG: hypothetical protein JJ896_16330 [Rhodothermales bacterium]|nr:hypothetical protein [Rhodothermales bacterium]MBO6781224.1 hypothetical protein [Rhodothermales bacterium]
MSLSFGLSPWILILLGLLAVAGAIWLYRNTVPRVESSGRIVLSGLRMASLLLLIFLLVEPLITRERTAADPPVVALLIDDSQSMVADGDTTAIRAAAAGITPPGADVRAFRFATDLQVDVPDSMHFSRGRTDISAALEQTLAELEGENLRAVVLVSDGRYNTGRNPLHIADRFPVPVHTVVLGDTTSRQDVQVRRVLTNEVAYRGTALPMEVGIRHEGFGNARVTVRVLEGGRVLDQEQVTLPAEAGEVPVTLEVVPDTTGLVRYDISVSRSVDEFTYRNNVASVAVQVLESRRRVLLLGGAPSPDLTAIRAALGTDDELAVDLFVRRSSGGYFQGPLPDLTEYDLLILSGWPSQGTDAGDVDRVASAVAEESIPLLLTLGQRTDFRLMQRLGPILPVQPRVIRSGRTEGRPVRTGAGLRHPALALPANAPGDAWNALPPMAVTDVTWQTAADAQVLATTAIRGVTLDDPSLVLRRRSGARAAVLLASGFWQWSNLPPSLEAYQEVWPTLTGNLVQWLAAPEDDRPVRVRPLTTSFEGGERVEFFGQVYDESAQPVPGATVDLQIRTPDGTTLPFAMRSIGSGRYRADAGTLPEGRYAYTAAASLANEQLGEDSGVFSVGPLALEYQDTRADAALMRQIALRTGGQALDLSSLGALSQPAAQASWLHPRDRVVRSSIRLWQRYPFLVLVLVLLTAEWFLRKRRGLV